MSARVLNLIWACRSRSAIKCWAPWPFRVYTKARLYNEHDQNLLMAIAGQTAIALQNARLFEQTKKQANEAAALNEIMQEISQRVDLEHVSRRPIGTSAKCCRPIRSLWPCW